MSEENVEIILRVYATFNKAADLRRAGQDWELMPEWDELFEPDVVLEDAPEIPGSVTYTGLDEVKRWLWDATDLFPEGKLEARDLLVRGGRVAVAAHGEFRGSASGVPVEVDMTHVWTVRNGRIAHIRAYFDREEALEAAGLSE